MLPRTVTMVMDGLVTLVSLALAVGALVAVARPQWALDRLLGLRHWYQRFVFFVAAIAYLYMAMYFGYRCMAGALWLMIRHSLR